MPLYSGLGYRVFTFVVGTAVMIAWVMVYAAKVKKNPQSSLVYKIDRERDLSAFQQGAAAEPFTGRRATVLLLFLGGMGLLVWGILEKGWYIDEIGALFLAMGILMGLCAGLPSDKIAKAFVAGARDMVGVALIIACARALLILTREGQVLDTLLHYSSQSISGLPAVVAAQLMFLLQCGINFFIHSGSGQAALTMPVLGAARRPRRHHPPDHGLRLPALRIRQPDPAHLGGHHGGARHGQDPLGQVGALLPPADAGADGLEPVAPGAAGSDPLGPVLAETGFS